MRLIQTPALGPFDQPPLLQPLFIQFYMRISLCIKSNGDENISDDGGDYSNQGTVSLQIVLAFARGHRL